MGAETAETADLDLESRHNQEAAAGVNLIGVFSSDNIEYNGHRGYALVIRTDRVVISKRSKAGARVAGKGWLDYFVGNPEGAETATAFDLSRALYSNRYREFKEADIAQIIYRRSSPFWGGYAIFKTSEDCFRISTAVLSPWNPSAISTADKLVQSLIVFAPRKLYDDKTGRLLVDEMLTRSGRLIISPGSQR